MKKFLTSILSVTALLYLQLFVSVEAAARESKLQIVHYVSLTQKNIDLAILDFNNIKTRNFDGLFEYYKSNGQIELNEAGVKQLGTLDRKTIIPKIVKTKTGYNWSVEKGIDIKFSTSSLLVGKVYINDKLILLPQAGTLIDYVKHFQNNFESLNLNHRTSYTNSILNFLVPEAEATSVFIMAVAVAVGFFCVMGVAVKANASTLEAKCADENNCNCINDLGISPQNINLIMTDLMGNNDSLKKFQSIDPTKESCAKELGEVLSTIKNNKKIDFGENRITDITKNICKQAKFAKECENKKSLASKETAPRGEKHFISPTTMDKSPSSATGVQR